MNTVLICEGLKKPNSWPYCMRLVCLVERTILTFKRLGENGPRKGRVMAVCSTFSSTWESRVTRLKQSVADQPVAAY